jgi:SAM-dependent methyltransferase
LKDPRRRAEPDGCELRWSAAGLRELETMALAVNYHRWTFQVIEPFIGSRVLEVGAGLGEVSQFLSENAALTVLDSDSRCVDHLRRRFARREKFVVVEGDIAGRLPADFGQRFDTVLCINVMEHIEDDRAALRNMYGALEPGGRLVLLVPAHPRIYGTLDLLVGHYRRYTRRDLAAETRAAGFRIVHSTYFNSLAAIGRYLIGRVVRQIETGKGQVLLYDRFVVPVLSRLERVVPPPFGQSLILVGTKPPP